MKPADLAAKWSKLPQPYGRTDNLPHEAILERLLALNLERAGA